MSITPDLLEGPSAASPHSLPSSAAHLLACEPSNKSFAFYITSIDFTAYFTMVQSSIHIKRCRVISKSLTFSVINRTVYLELRTCKSIETVAALSRLRTIHAETGSLAGGLGVGWQQRSLNAEV